MRIDEDTLRAALHDLPDDVPDDLLDRVHRGGRRRLRRRRFAAVASTTACVAAAGAGASAYLLDTGRGTGNGNATVAPAGAPAQTLYAAPPAAGADCASGSGGHAAASAQPKLLWLPRDTQVRYAFVRAYTDNCPRPHVALTMLKQDGGVVTTGVVVSGPNAPTAEQAGMEGHGRSFAGDTGHSAIDAHPATEFSIDGFTTAFWTDSEGGQWQAQVRGMSQAAAVALLDRLRYDDAAGTASLAAAGADGWSVAPAASDEAVGARGTVLVQWVLPSGDVADATITATPSRLDQIAATSMPDPGFTTVQGHRAVFSTDPQFGRVSWQPEDGVSVEVAVERGSADEALAAARSLAPATADDPRISPN